MVHGILTVSWLHLWIPHRLLSRALLLGNKNKSRIFNTANKNPLQCCQSFLQLEIFFKYRSSSNNSRGRLFLFSHQKGAIIRGKAIIRGRRLFQLLLTGGHALNILFYYTIKSKTNHIKNKPNMGFLVVSNLFSWKSEIHEHYHRKNCKKNPSASVTIQLWQMKACLLPKMSIFNLRGRG